MASQDTPSQPFHWHYTELNDHDFQIRGRTVFFVIVLFSVVLLFSLLFLYARWVCRYHRHHFPSSSSDPTSHAPSPERRVQGLDQTSIRSLPMVLYKSSSVGPTPSNNNSARDGIGNSECCICLGMFEDGEKVKVLPKCHHCFHGECVDKWLMARSSCPLCRASLFDDDSQLLVVVVPVATE